MCLQDRMQSGVKAMDTPRNTWSFSKFSKLATDLPNKFLSLIEKYDNAGKRMQEELKSKLKEIDKKSTLEETHQRILSLENSCSDLYVSRRFYFIIPNNFSYAKSLLLLEEDKSFLVRKTIFPLQIDWPVSPLFFFLISLIKSYSYLGNQFD